MGVTLTALPQLSLADATTEKNKLQQFFVDEEINNDHVAKQGQIDRHFFTPMPKAREAEFDASDQEKQSKFYTIGALAQVEVKNNPTKSFLDAWEEQYDIIFP